MENPPLPKLRGDLQYTVHRQGERLWYAVREPKQGRFLKLGQTEYLIASTLNGTLTAAEVAAIVDESQPEQPVTPEKVNKVFQWLMKQGLVNLPGTGDSDGPVGAKPRRIGLPNPLYTKVPLLSGKHLERIASWMLPLASQWTLVMVAALALLAAIAVIGNWTKFTGIASGLFVEDGRLYWLIAWLFLKAFHELGHALVAIRVGSQIRSAGISFIYLAPVPYVDISDLWMIPNRWHRTLCCAAGMLVEICLASIAALVALSTDNQSLQYFCSAVATLGTVSTIAFNANPLIRFDGYFILSDMLDRPNLWTEATAAFQQFVRKLTRPTSPVEQRMTVGLVAYGLAAFLYRMLLLATITVWTLWVWKGLGVLLVLWGSYSVVFLPLLKRWQAASASAAAASAAAPSWIGRAERLSGWVVAGLLVAALAWVPSPVQPTMPGVVSLRDPLVLRSQTDGVLVEEHITTGTRVHRGDIIAVFANSELELEFATKEIEVETAQETIRSLRAQGKLTLVQSEQANLASLQEQLAQLRGKVEHLEIRAPADGTVYACDLGRQQGKFFTVGEPLCFIAQQDGLDILASVDQASAEAVRAQVGQTLRFRTGAGLSGAGTLQKVDPRGSLQLPDPGLAALYGGPLTVDMGSHKEGEYPELTEPRFNFTVTLPPESAARVVPGQLAFLKIPGQSASLLDALGNWLEKKFSNLIQSAKTTQTSG